MRNARYLYDNSGQTNSFATAFQLDGMVGTDSLIAAPIVSMDDEISIIEIGNALSQSALANVAVYDETGVQKTAQTIGLLPHAVYHLNLSTILAQNGRGVVTVQGNLPGSIMAVVMQYNHAPDGSINYIYGVAANQAQGAVLRQAQDRQAQEKGAPIRGATTRLTQAA